MRRGEEAATGALVEPVLRGLRGSGSWRGGVRRGEGPGVERVRRERVGGGRLCFCPLGVV